MEEHFELRQAVITWSRQARSLPQIPQAITDAALATRPEWEPLENAVSAAASMAEHRDLYANTHGDWAPSYRTLLTRSGLGDATRLTAQGARVPESVVADSFVSFSAAPAPVSEDWLLLVADVPQGARIQFGRYTLQTFTSDELRLMHPMPAICDLQPEKLDLSLLAGAPFLQPSNLSASPRAAHAGFGAHGPRSEAQHWRSLLPLILWDSEPLRVAASFDVERGRRFGLHPTTSRPRSQPTATAGTRELPRRARRATGPRSLLCCSDRKDRGRDGRREQ